MASTSVRVARALNAVAAAILLLGAGWQVVLVGRGQGWWRILIAVGGVLLARAAIRVARYGPRG